MSPLRSLSAGLRALFHGPAVDAEIDDELRDFIARATADNIRNGMTPDAAARAARIQVGGTATREEVRTSGWESGIEFLLQDIRYAMRGLQRNPGFAAIAVLTLALGIGANTAMFSVVNAVMLRPLPYRDAGKLALIWTDDAKRGLHREATAWSTVMDWRQANRTFQDVAYFTTGRVAPMTNNPAASRGRAREALVSGNLLPLLGVAPAQGRLLTSADEEQHAPVAVISYAFWQRFFAGAPGVVGKTISLDGPDKAGGGQITVVGVMPADFYFPDKVTDFWIPATNYWRFERERSERFLPWARRWTAIGRLRPEASLADARADLARVGRQLSSQYRSNFEEFPGFDATVLPVLDSIAGQSLQSALWVLLGAVSLVLLVACVNVANLLLARGASRQQEFAVRRAIGAGRGRIVRQLVVESLLLALVGGVTGVLIAAWGTEILATAAAAYVPRISEITLDWRVLSFAMVASIIAGVAFGLVPALKLSDADASEALKEGGRGTGRLKLRRSRSALVIAECALALVLLMGAGLLLRSLQRLQSVDPGFDPHRVLTMRMEFPAGPPPTAEERTQTSLAEQARAHAGESAMNAFVTRLKGMPGVEGVGFTDDLFINGQGNKSITIPGRSADEFPAGELNDGVATPGFFTALRVPLRKGRALTDDDATQRIRALWAPITTSLSLAEKERLAIPEPVVVNEAFVQRFFPNADPIGKRFCMDPTNKTYWYEIVGVVGDMHRSGLERRAIPEYFGSYFPSPTGRADLLVRTTGEPLQLAATVRREVLRAFPNITIVTVSTADAQLDDFSALRRLQTSLLTVFALLAVILAAVGIFGLVHYAVAERTREIGVRVALGATPREVLSLVVRQGMRMPVIGIVVGLVVSAGLTRVMSSLLFNVGATDPLTFAGVALVLGGVAAAACYVAARRAVRIDPILALRSA